MPTLPTYTKCNILGCKNKKAKRGGFCIEHGGSDVFVTHNRHSQQYKIKQEKYDSKQWKGLRARQLSKYPVCAGCYSGGIVTPANTVDHIFPWSHIGEDAFYRNIFQSLCVSCHTHKTAMEVKGKYRRYGKPNIDYTKDDYAYVMRINSM